MKILVRRTVELDIDDLEVMEDEIRNERDRLENERDAERSQLNWHYSRQVRNGDEMIRLENVIAERNQRIAELTAELNQRERCLPFITSTKVS